MAGVHCVIIISMYLLTCGDITKCEANSMGEQNVEMSLLCSDLSFTLVALMYVLINI